MEIKIVYNFTLGQYFLMNFQNLFFTCLSDDTFQFLKNVTGHFGLLYKSVKCILKFQNCRIFSSHPESWYASSLSQKILKILSTNDIYLY